MILHLIILIIILSSVAIVSVTRKKLTIPAAITGWITGFLIYVGTGFTGIAMIATFFILGTWATSHKTNTKRQLGLLESGKPQRTAGQVVANAGVAAIVSILAWHYAGKAMLFQLMAAASLASAAADTISSELGNVYGRKFYNIISLKKDTRGLDGVVSLEGTLLGIVASTIIAVIYAIGYGFSFTFFIIVFAGTIGNIFDSIFGAVFERKGYITNNGINFSNTAIAAIVATIFYLAFNN